MHCMVHKHWTIGHTNRSSKNYVLIFTNDWNCAEVMHLVFDCADGLSPCQQTNFPQEAQFHTTPHKLHKRTNNICTQQAKPSQGSDRQIQSTKHGVEVDTRVEVVTNLCIINNNAKRQDVHRYKHCYLTEELRMQIYIRAGKVASA